MPFNHFSEIDKTASLIAFIAGIWGAILSFAKSAYSSSLT